MKISQYERNSIYINFGTRKKPNKKDSRAHGVQVGE